MTHIQGKEEEEAFWEKYPDDQHMRTAEPDRAAWWESEEWKEGPAAWWKEHARDLADERPGFFYH